MSLPRALLLGRQCAMMTSLININQTLLNITSRPPHVILWTICPLARKGNPGCHERSGTALYHYILPPYKGRRPRRPSELTVLRHSPVSGRTPKSHVPGRDRSHDLRLHSRAPYPLGHRKAILANPMPGYHLSALTRSEPATSGSAMARLNRYAILAPKPIVVGYSQ